MAGIQDEKINPEEKINQEGNPNTAASDEEAKKDMDEKEASEETKEEKASENAEASDGAEEKETGSENGNADEEDVVDGEWQSAPEDGGIRGFFKKNKKDKKDLQIDELTDRVRRQMAEFDNFRKRTEKEKAASFEIGARSVIEKILPVVDNFERGLDKVDLSDPFADGMNKIYKQLMTTLEAMDVKPIEAEGKPFDPDLHNAVMHVDDETVGENIVVEELQKGYTYRGTVVRYSMVKVAN